MRNRILLKRAAMGAILGLLTTSCAGPAMMTATPPAGTTDTAAKSAKPVVNPAVAKNAARDQAAKKQNERKQAINRSKTLAKNHAKAQRAVADARKALDHGKTSRAISHAEIAVAAEPRMSEHRVLLGDSYMAAGRFASAASAFSGAVELGAKNPQMILSYSLARIARGESTAALALMNQHRDILPSSDVGLAMALAGNLEGAILTLTQAARQPSAGPRVRQNLALTMALAGRWLEARMLASQDLPPSDIKARMEEWSLLVQQKRADYRVASLLDITPVRDAGMPQRLALSNYPAAPIRNPTLADNKNTSGKRRIAAHDVSPPISSARPPISPARPPISPARPPISPTGIAKIPTNSPKIKEQRTRASVVAGRSPPLRNVSVSSTSPAISVPPTRSVPPARSVPTVPTARTVPTVPAARMPKMPIESACTQSIIRAVYRACQKSPSTFCK